MNEPTVILIYLFIVNAERDTGVKAIENLMEKKGKFDYILLETTGLADPGPIASMFWLDEGLGSEIMLDGQWTLCLCSLPNSHSFFVHTYCFSVRWS